MPASPSIALSEVFAPPQILKHTQSAEEAEDEDSNDDKKNTEADEIIENALSRLVAEMKNDRIFFVFSTLWLALWAC